MEYNENGEWEKMTNKETTKISSELRTMLQPESKIRVDFGENMPGNCLIHIRAIVDGECIIFEKRKDGEQQWGHYTETYDYFRKMRDAGYLSKGGIDDSDV